MGEGTNRRHTRRAPRRAIAAITVLAAVMAPTAGGAGPQQQDSSNDGPTSEMAIGIDIDVEYAEPTDVADALDGLMAAVGDQLAALETAERAVTRAETQLEEATQAVEATEQRIDALVEHSDQLIVDAFVNPPAETAVDALTTATASDMAIKRGFLSILVDDDAQVLGQLETERRDLDEHETNQREIADDLAAKRADAEAELASLEAATSQPAAFIIEIEQRLERQAGEAAALESLDPELAAELRAEQEALAAKIQDILDAKELEEAVAILAEAERTAVEEAERRAAEEAERNREAEGGGAVELGPASGGLADVPCPGGGAITVDRTVAGNLDSLLSAAASDGIRLCGSGYRDPQQQIELRKANCGTSYDAIYEAPASSCSPVTARPGTSMHEQGLAIDFTCNGGGLISSRSSPCFQWLDGRAAGYGLYNLPSEPWHWSTNGN